MRRLDRVTIAVLSLAIPALAWGASRRVSVKGQAGGMSYTGAAASITTPGVSWGLLAGADVVPYVEGELSYQGLSYSTQGLASHSAVVEHGAQASLKVAANQGELGAFVPYALGGIAFSLLSANEDVAPFVEDAVQVKLPLAVGFDVNLPFGEGKAGIVGVRTTYQIALSSGAFPTLPTTEDANQVTAAVQFGASF